MSTNANSTIITLYLLIIRLDQIANKLLKGTKFMSDVIHPRVLNQIKLLKIYAPYKYFATITFQYLLSETEAKRSASIAIRRLNKKLLGRRYDKSKPINGIAVMEKACITSNGKKRDRANCHFHFLFHDHPSLVGSPQKLLERFERAFRSAALGLNLNESRSLVSRNGTNVQLVRDDGVFKYMVKEAKNPAWKQDERLFFLDSDGLVY
jgi:hypothetical protein